MYRFPNWYTANIILEPGAFSTSINDRLPEVNAVNYVGKDIYRILWVKQLIGLDSHEQAYCFYDTAHVNIYDSGRFESCESLNYHSRAALAIAIAICEVYDTKYDYTTKMEAFETPVLFISSDQSEDLSYDFQQANQVILFPNHEHKKVLDTRHSGLINCKTNETLGHIQDYLVNFGNSF